MMQTNNNMTQNSEIFRDLEKTGEQFKMQFRQLSEQAQKRIDSQVESSKFEAAYALIINKNQRKITMHEVKDVRNKLWKQALAKANGDSKKAVIFYDETCAFA